MQEATIKEVITMICNDYVDLLIVGLEEHKELFPNTISCINLISELKKSKNLIVLNDVFIDKFIDKIYQECSRYIGSDNSNE